MNKEQFKEMLKELISEGAIEITVSGESTQYSHYVRVGVNIDGETLTEAELQLDREW